MAQGRGPILLGKVIGTHGIRGQLRVHSFSGEFEHLLGLQTVTLKDAAGTFETFTVAVAALHGRRVLLKLQGFDDIDQVLPLVGREVYAERELLPELAEDEFFWDDLLGLTVVTDGGQTLGTIHEIIATGSNDVYVVRGGPKEYLIPALEDVVTGVDLEAGTMTISPLEGLLDL